VLSHKTFFDNSEAKNFLLLQLQPVQLTQEVTVKFRFGLREKQQGHDAVTPWILQTIIDISGKGVTRALSPTESYDNFTIKGCLEIFCEVS
jgi:hypothetical protein